MAIASGSRFAPERGRRGDELEVSNPKQSGWQRFASRWRLATKSDVFEMEKRIMATQAEQAAQITADLKASNAQLKKLIADTQGLQPAVDELKAKILELEAALLAGGAITPEMVELAAEAKALTNTVDENVPELPTPPV